MSIFEHRNRPADWPPHDPLRTLQTALEELEAQREQTPQMVDLKRILADRIAELEHRSS